MIYFFWVGEEEIFKLWIFVLGEVSTILFIYQRGFKKNCWKKDPYFSLLGGSGRKRNFLAGKQQLYIL